MYIPSKFNKIKQNNNLINSNKIFIHPDGVPNFITMLSGGINIPKYKTYVGIGALNRYPCHYSYVSTEENKKIFAYAFKNAEEINIPSIREEYYDKQYYKFIQYIPFQYPLSFNSRFFNDGLLATMEIYDENFKLIYSISGSSAVNVILQNGPEIIYIRGYQIME